MAINQDRLHEFLLKAVGDIGAAMSAALVAIGDRLGLYKALAAGGPMTPEQLASKTGTAERYIREWLLNQAAGGYVQYDPATRRYSMNEEQAFALANDQSPCFLAGAFDVIQSVHRDEPKIREVFKSGGGVPWGDHDSCLFCGTERFFAPSYRGNLVDSWIPALDGAAGKLKDGAVVADVGCGHGASTVIMAQAFPRSKFVGYDAHAPSIECARKRAAAAGVSGNCIFEKSDATSFPKVDGGFDLVACFDCLHDMGDPVGCAKRVRETLKPDGAWMVVEPNAADTVEGNLNPVGRTFSAASAMICVPASLAFKGPALGACAGQARLSEVISKGGFSRVRRAAETPFNMVLEARV